MALAALAGVIAMLAIYAAAVIVAMQHIAERHSSYLVRSLLRRSAPWAIILGIITVGCGIVALLPATVAWNAVSLVMLLAAVGIALWGGVRIWWTTVADGAVLVAWLRPKLHQHNVPTLQDMLWNAITRADRRVVVSVLQAVQSGNQQEKSEFLSWLVDHRDVLSSEWLTREVLEHLVVEGVKDLREPEPLQDFDKATVVAEGLLGDAVLQQLELPPIDPADPHVLASQRQDEYNSHLTALIFGLLEDALNAEAFGRAEQIIRQVGNRLAHASPWTQAHASLLSGLGYPLWNIGEPSVAIPRTARIPAQLTEVQAVFGGRLRDVWKHLQKIADPIAIEAYAGILGRLAGEVSLEGLQNILLPRIYDVLEDGFTKRLLTIEAVEQLAADLGLDRYVALEDKHTQERIDEFIVMLAAMLVELGDDERSVSHLLGNGYLSARPQRGKIIRRDWLQSESYAVVERLLK
jgi:hypothetical protein